MELCLRGSWGRHQRYASEKLANLLTRASRGAHYEDAEFFRVSPESVTVDMIKLFWLPDLTTQYEHITPNLRFLLKKVIGKESPLQGSTTRDPDHVCLSEMSNRDLN
jgi:hypothetical protein